ncbi:unnamed protein product [Sympodiomycopsis kandeliae]
MTSISNPASKIVVVIGAGPGLGFAIARRFAQAGHPVALLSRQKDRLEGLAQEINTLKVGRAEAFSADATDAKSLSTSFKSIQEKFGTKTNIWGGIFNSGLFSFSPILDTTEEQFTTQLNSQALGGFLFAQAFLRSLPEQTSNEGDHEEGKAFLAFTGATASIKGSANFSSFAASKAALRSLSQSLARELHPKGIHVFHTILDGLIDTEMTRGHFGKDFEKGTRLEPDHIAESYYHVAAQRKSAWTQEIDLRPFSEKF